MDRITKTTKRVTGKKCTNAGPSTVRERGGRGSNWTAIESDILLDVAQEVQLKNRKTSLNFTKTDATEIHGLFCQKIQGSQRTPGQLITRIGTMKKEFAILRRLSLRSGWSWNYEEGVVVAPSLEILKNAIEEKSVDSDQPLTQGKKIQKTINEKRKVIMEMNETNKEMLQTVKALVKGKSNKMDEMDKCIEKMHSLNIGGQMRF